jgi:hypothetical protein
MGNKAELNSLAHTECEADESGDFAPRKGSLLARAFALDGPKAPVLSSRSGQCLGRVEGVAAQHVACLARSQTLERCYEQIFQEKASGAETDRPQLAKLLSTLQDTSI